MEPSHENRGRAVLAHLGAMAIAVAAFCGVAAIGGQIEAPGPTAGRAAASGDLGAAGSSALPQVLLAIAVVLCVARAVGALFRRLGQPQVLGEMTAGILLGPSLLGSLFPDAAAFLLPQSIEPLLGILAQIGVVLFLFLVGLELDTAMLQRRTRVTLTIAHASIAVPFLSGGALALVLYPLTSTADVPFVTFALFVAVALSVTAFPVLARILTDRGLARSQIGVVALACAATNDVAAWCLLALVVGFAKATTGAAVGTVALVALFTAAMVFVVRPIVARWVRSQSAARSDSAGALTVLLFGILVSALVTEAIGIHAMFGAFLFGAIVPHDSRLAHAATTKIRDLVVVLFLPIFFAFTGLRTQIGLVSGAENWLLCLLVVAVAMFGKIGGTYVAARLCGSRPREAAALGALMNTRGLMELVVLNVGLDLGIVSPALFAMMVAMALVTTLSTTPLLQWLGIGSPDSTATPNPTPREPMPTLASPPTGVVICGGGFAGLLLARQLRREMPDLSVTIVEKTARPLPAAAHKVGESSVELGCQYFERLGLREYMRERQLPKMGLRFFPGGGDLPLHERTEIGPCAEPIVPSYQIDRGRIEDDLRGMLEREGVTLIEGAAVKSIDLGKGSEAHRIGYEQNGALHELRSRWVVDATGRNAIVRKEHKLTRPSRHVASSGWYRIKGRFDINGLVPKDQREWHSRPLADKRWLSTNHFMGPGYWVWVIPLSTGNTSIGVVIHEDTHAATNIAGLEATQAFIAQHEPHLAKALEGWEVLDFLCLRNYSYSVSQAWSEDRWALVGVAGAFVDPLFSPGNDFIALANNFTVEMMRADRAGEDLAARAELLNQQYRALLFGSFELFRQAAPIYGHARAMATKVFWNNFAYWSYTCQFFQQDLCRLGAEDQAKATAFGRRFLELTSHVETLLHHWATMAPERPAATFLQSPAFPSVLIEAHTAVAKKMSFDETLAYMARRLEQGLEIVGEIVLRITQELGPEQGKELLDRVHFATWGVPIPKRRLEIEGLSGLERRHGLPDLARDVERGLGPVRRHPDAARARAVLAGCAASA